MAQIVLHINIKICARCYPRNQFICIKIFSQHKLKNIVTVKFYIQIVQRIMMKNCKNKSTQNTITTLRCVFNLEMGSSILEIKNPTIKGTNSATALANAIAVNPAKNPLPVLNQKNSRPKINIGM